MRQIFVCGCDRSGTTMLAAMIGNCSQVLCLPEAQFIGRYAHVSGKKFNSSRLLELVRSDLRFALWRLDLSSSDLNKLREARGYAEFFNVLARVYGELIGKNEFFSWIDHAPINVSFMGRLSQAFPDARFINLYRDGRAVANSWLPLDWGPNHIIAAAERWARAIGQGFVAEQLLGSERILHVCYEKILCNPKVEMLRVADFLNIPYSDNLLNPSGFVLPSYSQSTHRLVGQAVDAKRIDSWRTRLLPREIEVFEAIVGDLLVYLGYPLLYCNAMLPTKRERVIGLVKDLACNFLNRGRRILRRCTK